MKALLLGITDFVSTKRGMWITLGVWLAVTLLLGGLAPGAKDYEVTSIDSLPEDAQSVIARNKLDQYFESFDGLPAILVFHAEEGEADLEALKPFFEQAPETEGLKSIVPLASLPPQAEQSFRSEDGSTVIVPVLFDASMETKELRTALEHLDELAGTASGVAFYVTGPAGIAVDSLNLFSRADVVLILSTVGLILILLVVIYRSPLLALIPLLAASFVYEAVNQTLGLMGAAGLVMSNQSLSIMTILLFAAVTDYSLFVFSRYRDELKRHENKYEAMKHAMRGTGVPVFFAGGTVLAAMLMLFFAEYGDYRNFAPIFGVTMAIVMIASVTLVPALFTLFGRKSFWPLIPKVGDPDHSDASLWSRAGRLTAKRPAVTAIVVGVLLVVSALNVANIRYEYDLMKSFPSDMPSRAGYEIVADKFESGLVAETTVIVEAKQPLTDEQKRKFADALAAQPLVSQVRENGSAEDGRVAQFSLTYGVNPYAEETMDALEALIGDRGGLLAESGIDGSVYFAGETASSIDDRAVNRSDIVRIVILETLLILALLVYLTRSVKMPVYMMATILISYVSALGLGLFLTDLLFGVDTYSTRIPVYAFVFLVALGIDYNIILASRFLEERRHHPVRKAVEIAVSKTGGVISSAGIILAATFAVLMTQPVQVLFVFGFITAVGILLDTFLVRGFLLPSLIVLFERDKQPGKAA
jgi:Predicted drug exporters of the RND superfamily